MKQFYALLSVLIIFTCSNINAQTLTRSNKTNLSTEVRTEQEIDRITSDNQNNENLFHKNNNDPAKAPNDWIKYCGPNADGMGTYDYASTFICAARWDTMDLRIASVASGDIITKVKIVPLDLDKADFTIHIYQGGIHAADPGELLYTQALTDLIEGEENIINLDEEFTIDATIPLWVGYEVVSTGGRPAGCDAGPMENLKGNLMFFEGIWTTLLVASGGTYFSNWNIEAFVEPGNVTLPSEPINFTVTPIGTSLKADLEWTNPTTTIAGDPLTNISKIVLERNNVSIKEFENPPVGETMTYIDEVSEAGEYEYKVYATTPNGIGLPTYATAIIGDLCPVFIEMFDEFGDGWENSHILITSGGITYGKASIPGPYGEMRILVPSVEIDFTYVRGTDYNSDIYYNIYNADYELIYEEPKSATGPEEGLFFTYENDCGGDIGIEKIETTTFKIYPNPVDDMLYIETEENINYATIYNLTGRIVKSTNVVNKTINVSNLSSGVYFIRFQTVTGDYTVKIVKQ